MGSDPNAAFYCINGNKIISFSYAYPASSAYPVTCDYRGYWFGKYAVVFIIVAIACYAECIL